jgi:hypothetical protein
LLLLTLNHPKPRFLHLTHTRYSIESYPPLYFLTWWCWNNNNWIWKSCIRLLIKNRLLSILSLFLFFKTYKVFCWWRRSGIWFFNHLKKQHEYIYIFLNIHDLLLPLL